jgi:predicted nuclease with RNAse H fold
MRMLTDRGMRLAEILRGRGLKVEEGYPGGAQDLIGIARKQAGTPALQRALRGLGIRGDLDQRPLTHDELDAVTLAWVAQRFLEGRARVIGDPTEGTMVLPAGPTVPSNRRR